MLVLSRKCGERIHIGGGIELEVVAVQGNRVKLGIVCPREVRVLRAELLDATSPTWIPSEQRQPVAAAG